MTNNEAKTMIDDVFSRIRGATSIADLIEMLTDSKFINEKYPRIHFSIRASEIKQLQERSVLNHDLTIHPEAISNSNDVLTRLLYAIAWKNGDLNKLKHVVRGILEGDSQGDTPTSAFVFYQFVRIFQRAVPPSKKCCLPSGKMHRGCMQIRGFPITNLCMENH